MTAETPKKKPEPKYVQEYRCKRCSKCKDMWIDQILFKIEKINTRLDELEESVKFIKDEIHKIEQIGEDEHA